MTDPAITSVLLAQQASVSNQISIAVASKQLDAVSQQGEAVVALIDAAASLSREVGKGEGFDAVI